MDIVCEKCGAKIPFENLNVSTMIAKCDRCHTVFDFTSQVTSNPKPAPQTQPLQQMPLPPSISVRRPNEQKSFADWGYRDNARPGVTPVIITRRWFRVASLVMLLFALLWNAILVGWYAAAASHGATSIFFVFPVLHVAVGVFVGYVALAHLINKTTIHVDSSRITVRHHPLPWIGNLEIDASTLTQLYCTRRISHMTSGSESYEVHAARRDGTSLILVAGLQRPEEALFIEQEIEKSLGIVDKPVPGEIKHR